MNKIIEIQNPNLPYKKRYKLRRKTLSFHDRYFNTDESVLAFAHMSYKMWLTKIWGGYKELIFGKKATK